MPTLRQYVALLFPLLPNSNPPTRKDLVMPNINGHYWELAVVCPSCKEHQWIQTATDIVTCIACDNRWCTHCHPDTVLYLTHRIVRKEDCPARTNAA